MIVISNSVTQFIGCAIIAQLSICIAFGDFLEGQRNDFQDKKTTKDHQKHSRPIRRRPRNDYWVHPPISARIR